jgi:hypothetical protein
MRVMCPAVSGEKFSPTANANFSVLLNEATHRTLSGTTCCIDIGGRQWRATGLQNKQVYKISPANTVLLGKCHHFEPLFT